MEHQIFHVRVSDGRRVVLPAEACERLNIGVGQTLIIDVASDGVHLQSAEQMLAKFRSELNSKLPAGVSLADELIAERQQEAMRE